MTIRVLSAGAFLLAAVSTAPAQTAPARILVSNGLKASVEKLQPICDATTKRKYDVRFNSTAAVKKVIESGEKFDATLITVEAVDDLIKQGKLLAASRVNVGRSELRIGIKSGAARPYIGTKDSLKKALREAKSITYPQDGASRGYIEKTFETLGIATEIKPKIILAPGSGPATESVAAGKAQFVITLLSEIVPIPGVEALGALPEDLQYEVRFAAAVSASATNADAAKALIACVISPNSGPVLKKMGIDVLK
jgi:molybdate transport system substrate-binding protein